MHKPKQCAQADEPVEYDPKPHILVYLLTLELYNASTPADMSGAIDATRVCVCVDLMQQPPRRRHGRGSDRRGENPPTRGIL